MILAPIAAVASLSSGYQDGEVHHLDRTQLSYEDRSIFFCSNASDARIVVFRSKDGKGFLRVGAPKRGDNPWLYELIDPVRSADQWESNGLRYTKIALGGEYSGVSYEGTMTFVVGPSHPLTASLEISYGQTQETWECPTPILAPEPKQ